MQPRLLAALLLLPVSAFAEEGLIQGGREGPGLETAEINVHVRDDPARTVAELTRYNIVGNLLREDTQSAEHWFVLFCVEWYEPCQAHATDYERISAEVQSAWGDGALLRAPVRFAKVSCAKDKPLCNEFEVEEYPTIAHYAGGKRLGTWTPGRKRPGMRNWINEQLAQATPVSIPAPATAAGRSPRLIANFFAIVLLFCSSLCHVLKELVSWRPKFMGAQGAVWRQIELHPTAAPASTPAEASGSDARPPQPRTLAATALPEDWTLEL